MGGIPPWLGQGQTGLEPPTRSVRLALGSRALSLHFVLLELCFMWQALLEGREA